jgi:hypothetical protein
MAKPRKYTKVHKVRLSEETNELLQEKSAIMELPPAVVIRVLVEHSLPVVPVPVGDPDVE